MKRKFRAFDDPELKSWLLDLIADPSPSFLGALAEAVLMATPEDYCVVRPFLIRFREKYRRVPKKARIHREKTIHPDTPTAMPEQSLTSVGTRTEQVLTVLQAIHKRDEEMYSEPTESANSAS